MKTRIIKEAKALLPAFVLTVGLTLAASVVWRGVSAIEGGILLFCIGCTLMGANCFGHEFSGQTIGLLLAQPMSRRRIWHEKMLVLGAAILLAFLAWFACFSKFTDTESLGGDVSPVSVLAVVSAGIFCSAPYLALKTRNTLHASLFVWMFPFGLCMCVVLVGHYFALDDFFDHHSPGPYVLTGVGVYCALAYWWGYATLKRFQSAAARPSEIALPERWQNALARPFGTLLPRYTSPVASLMRKEILLQRPTYVAAAALCVLAALGAISDKIHDSESIRGLLAASLVMCVGILPLVATGLSVAEERNLGMSSWHRTLPPSLRKQWLVKLTVVLGTCVLLGVILPCLMGATGWAMGLFPDAQQSPHQPIQWPSFSTVMITCLVYLTLMMIGIFASSVSATTFRAILLTLVLLAGIYLAIALSNWFVFRIIQGFMWTNSPNTGPHFGRELAMYGGMGFLLTTGLAVLGGLAYFNYRVAEPTPRRAWSHSGIVLGVAAALTTTCWLMAALLRF